MSVDRRSFLRSTVAGIAAMPAVRPTVSATAATLAPGDEDPLGVRDEFPITKTHAFLNNCAIAPLCRSGRDAAVAYLDEKLLDPFPEPDPKALLRLRERKESVRRKFAGLFGVSPREVGLVQSTSAGENIVARGLKLKAGDNVVIDDLHFETSFLLYRELEKELGIELRVVPHRNGVTHLADFDAACNARTRLVSVSWVSNRNGYRQNLKGLAEIAHARGAYLYADAIQAIGVFDTNVKDEGVDFLTCGGYKWLYANFGVAPFYVREELLDRIPSDRFGHLQIIGGTPEHDYQLQTTAAKYEYAAVAYTSVAQLDASLGLIARVGLARIEAQGVGLAHEVWQGLADLGFTLFTPKDNASPIVTVRHGRDAADLKKRFANENIVVLFRENDEFLRLGVGFYNNRAEIRRFLGVMAAVA